MNPLIRKEIRLLLWPWVGTMILSIVPGWLYLVYYSTVLAGGRGVQQSNDFALGLATSCFGVGVVVLALTPFGQEFALRTFSNVLAQPLERKQIWRTKVWSLVIAILACTAAFLISSQFLANRCWTVSRSFVGAEIHEEIHQLNTPAFFWLRAQWAFLFAAIGCAGGLWTTLVFRNIAAALSVTLMAPLLVMFFEQWLTVHFAPRLLDSMLPWSLWAYAIAAMIFARWYFLRAQDVGFGAGSVFIAPQVARGSSTTFRRSNRYFAVFKKEIQLQQVPLWIAAGIGILHLGSFVLRKLAPGNPHADIWYVINNVWLLWLAVPFIIGCSIVAEERRLGTLESSLTQPVPRLAQLLIKIVFGLAAAVLFGAGVPVAIERLWNLIGPANEILLWLRLNTGLLKGPLFIAACAMFVSMFSRSAIESICRAIVLIPALYVIASLMVKYGIYGQHVFDSALIVAAIWLSWKNFQRAQIRTREATVAFIILGGCCLTAWGAASFTYHRAWEYLTRMEPKHGIAVMHPGQRIKVFSSESGPLALLPDGRIWRADYIEHLSDHVRTLFHSNRIFAPSGFDLTNAAFIPDTNWIDLAVARRAFAIKSDGTLWEVNPTTGITNGTTIQWRASAPRQFGTDNNWIQVVGGMANQFLALKNDGTLWGWGGNWFRELGSGPTHVDKPKPVWPDDRWTKVFMCGSICFGFNTDGTTWRWGAMARNHTSIASLPTSYPSPAPSPFPGTNWTTFYAGSSVLLGLKNDGTLWYVAPPKEYYWDHKVLGQTITNCTEPRLFTPAAQWRAITHHAPLSVINASGEWRLASGVWIHQDDLENVELSRYTDWLAVSAEDAVIGMAADGTITCWMDLDRDYNFAPSRRPTWSTNIFATR